MVTVSPGWQLIWKQSPNKNVEIIYNGYDPEDFDFERPEPDRLLQ